MQVIGCTQKLQKEMVLKKSDLFTKESDNGQLGDWIANLIYIERRKCIVFVNKKTLFNFIVLNLKREQIRNLNEVFLSNFVNNVLFKMNLESIIPQVIDEYEVIKYSKTNDRSVLGSMNDMILHYKYHVDHFGGIFNCDISEIIYRINRTPFSALKWKFPLDALMDVYQIQRKIPQTKV
jgi:hypothetical protein